MTITNAALNLKLDLLLKNGAHIDSDTQLVWTDSDGTSHICKMPDGRIEGDRPPLTLCGRSVNTLRFGLVEAGRWDPSSCPDCTAQAMVIENAMLTQSSPASTNRSTTSSVLWGLFLGTLIIGAATLDQRTVHQGMSGIHANPSANKTASPPLRDYDPDVW